MLIGGYHSIIISATYISFAIKTSDNKTIQGESPIKIGQVSGNALLNVTTVPYTFH